MITDLWTVAWKEWKEFLAQRSTLLGMLVFLGIFAIVFPYQRGAEWVDSPIGVLNLLFIPLFLVLTVIADAFAGERERHTLDTLLASRLSDRAILFGKLAAAVSYGGGLILAALVVALISASVSAGEVLAYPARLAVAAVGFGLLSIVLVAAAGILVSLRAATVRNAQQTLNFGLLLLGVAVVIVYSLMPAPWRQWLTDTVRSASIDQLMLAGGLLLLALDCAIVGATVAQFRRSRLVLD
jgi:ABC-2 type transport system permease protein